MLRFYRYSPKVTYDLPSSQDIARICAFHFFNRTKTQTFIKCYKRQLIPVAVIKSNIYNIFYKIYQCVFYVIYKLDVLLESMVLLESFDV